MFQGIAEALFGVQIHTAGESSRVHVGGGGGGPPSGSTSGPRIWKVSEEVQSQFANGAKYNMRLVLRGARGTGKSSMLARLQGVPVSSQYVPTGAIQASTIRWVPKASKDEEAAVKIDVWDVVDKGSVPASQGASSSMFFGGGPANIPQLPVDASTIDVYRGTNCVVFMVDITRPETLHYVETEAHNVPLDCLVLVCVNFYDLHAERAISEEAIARVCNGIRRSCTPFIASVTQAKPDEGVSVGATWLYTSMMTGFGMRPLYTYLNTPFNYLRIRAYEEEMRGMYAAISKLHGEFNEIRQRQNYEEYLRWSMHVESVRDGVAVEETKAARQHHAHPFNKDIVSRPAIECLSAVGADVAAGSTDDGQQYMEARGGYDFVDEGKASARPAGTNGPAKKDRQPKDKDSKKAARPHMKETVRPAGAGAVPVPSPVASLDDLLPATIEDSFFGAPEPADGAPIDGVDDKVASPTTAEAWVPNPVVNERAVKKAPVVEKRLVEDAVSLLKTSFGDTEALPADPAPAAATEADDAAPKEKKAKRSKDKDKEKEKDSKATKEKKSRRSTPPAESSK